ncbi:MAG: shikimate kinase [Geobacter sp.]|nr:shikimate kinase [Geobacter sp.]
MKNVILTGFMGSGKSSVGRIVAKRLGYEFRDLDAVIMEEAGLSINDIFSRHGEEHFRAVESRAVERVAGSTALVVATGGGAVISTENRRLFRSSGIVINLMASMESILNRLRNDSSRPLLRGPDREEKISRLLSEREACYADADIRIDTTGKKVEDVAAEILTYLKGKL